MPEPAPVRLAVFDCDGTLVDSEHHIVAAIGDAWIAHGFRAPVREAVRGVIGLPLLEALQRLAPAAADPDTLGRMRDHYVATWQALRDKGQLTEALYPGTVEALDALEGDGWLLGIATGKSRRGLDATLKSHGLETRFVTLQTADAGPGKPNPHMLERAMAETGAVPESTVMVGDTTFDMAMARAAGAYAVGVGWGYHDAERLHAAGAQAVVNDYADLPAAIRELTDGGG